MSGLKRKFSNDIIGKNKVDNIDYSESDSDYEFEEKPDYSIKFTDEELLDHFKKNPIIKKYIRYCRYLNCEKQASFGPVLGGKYRCATHKLSTDVNNRAKKCQYEGCKLQASFGPETGPKVFRCGNHKLPSDINKTNAYCVFPSCKKTASFGPVGGKKLTCITHKESNYVNIKRNYKKQKIENNINC
jgi:hypothetical protein